MHSSQDLMGFLEKPKQGNSHIVHPLLETERQLQSLGFMVNNGRARFDLGDNSAGSPNSVGMMDIPMITSDESLSFVVLNKDSMDSIQALSLASYIEIQQKALSIDCNSTISVMSPSEVHQKLNEVLQENTKLRETLKQNNRGMMQQFNTLQIWQEKLMQVYQSHKKKFAETSMLINSLKMENADLKMRLSMHHGDMTKMVQPELLCSGTTLINKQGDGSDEMSGSEDEATVTHDFQESLESMVMNFNEMLADKLIEFPITPICEPNRTEQAAELRSEQKRKCDNEHKSLNTAEVLLDEPRTQLCVEKASLVQQNQLYESGTESLSCEQFEQVPKGFEAKYAQLNSEMQTLRETVKENEAIIQRLETNIAGHVEHATLLKTQLQIYETDFKQERMIKAILLEDKNKLEADLIDQIQLNGALAAELNR